MQIPVQQFPILSPGQMNPYHQALQTGLENYTNIAKAAYTPATMQADIASKQAYANYLPYQNIATALSNPMTLAMMNGDQRQLMLNALGQMAGNLKNNSNNNQSGISGLWDNLKNWAMKSTSLNPQQEAINNYVSNNPEAKEGMQSPNGYVIPGGKTANTPANNAAPPPALPQQDISNSSDFDTSSPSANALGIDTGSPEGNRALAMKMPSIKLQNAINANKARQVADAKIQAKSAQDAKTAAVNDGITALRLSRTADVFDNAYQNAFLKGWKYNALPSSLQEKFGKFDPNSYEATNAANNMIGDVEQQLFGDKNRASDFRTKLSGMSKLEIGMPESTERDVLSKIKSMSARTMQHSDFINYANQLGIKDQNKINNLWFDYNKDVPFYDVKSHKILDDNLTDKSYQDYINKKANLSSQTSKNVSSSSPGVVSVEHNGKKYMHINGRWMQA